MCLTTNFAGTVEVAKTDMVVYKSGDSYGSYFRSEHQGFRYQKDKIQDKVELEITHAPYRFGRVYAYHQGYHGFSSFFKGNQVFLIPKGTKFVKGYDNDTTDEAYVAEQIAWIGNVWNPFTWIKVMQHKFSN